MGEIPTYHAAALNHLAGCHCHSTTAAEACSSYHLHALRGLDKLLAFPLRPLRPHEDPLRPLIVMHCRHPSRCWTGRCPSQCPTQTCAPLPEQSGCTTHMGPSSMSAMGALMWTGQTPSRASAPTPTSSGTTPSKRSSTSGVSCPLSRLESASAHCQCRLCECWRCALDSPGIEDK